MSLPRFHLPATHWTTPHLTLNGDEAQHCSIVMRKQPGDIIEIFDGAGRVAVCEITHVSKSEVQAKITTETRVEPFQTSIHLLPALIKAEPFEWLLEKAVELGATSIQPVISERTMRLHHDKHHATYVKTTNELLEKAGKSAVSLEAVIEDSAKASERKLFNNAAQAWNHAFFWEAMSPKRAGPDGGLKAAIEKAFGDMAGVKAAFVTAGVDQFGSGWAWLVSDADGGLRVLSTHDADDFVSLSKLTPLIVCDVWEHAYYQDHQNDRKAYLEAWFDALPNWRFAGRQFDAATAGGEAWRYPAPRRQEQGRAA